MSAERDELERLVHLRQAESRPWPPAFFASAPGDGTSIARRADDLLREGFGR
jgi:hypothetical protein